jgi:HAD superfamily hydrolase (TIGR01490 family)
MGRIAAIFDVDQTLVQGHTERIFFSYLIRHGLIRMPQVMCYLGRLARRPKQRFADKTYLEGLQEDYIVRLARQCCQEAILPRLSPAGLNCVREHQAQGHEIVLLTGSLAFLLWPLKEELGAHWLIATEVARDNGQFTGGITGIHPRGENKLRLLLELAHTQGLDLSRSYAYGDHIQDSHLFRGIGHPIVVNPSWRLKRLAQRRRWPIRYF